MFPATPSPAAAAAGTSSGGLALLISGIALGVSLATFAWKVVYDIYFDAPRLGVTLAALSVMGGAPPWPAYVVTVTNRGKRPTTLTSLWLVFGRPPRWWGRLLPKSVRGKLFTAGLMLSDIRGQALSTKVPGRLDVGEQASVYYDRALVEKNAEEHKERFMYGAAGSTTQSKNSRRLKTAEPPAK